MTVVFTTEAERDLGAIGRYLVDHNPSRALDFIAGLQGCCLELGRMPHASPLLTSRPGSGIRRRTYGNYLIFYRVSGTTVEVLHILHGARDVERILFPDG